MSTLDKQIQNFCKRYDAHITTPDFSSQEFKIEEQMVRIDLPEDRFRTLMNMEDKIKEWRFDERLRGSKFVDYVNHIYEKEYRESIIREKYSAVKKAYEHYQILLAMIEAEEIK